MICGRVVSQAVTPLVILRNNYQVNVGCNLLHGRQSCLKTDGGSPSDEICRYNAHYRIRRTKRSGGGGGPERDEVLGSWRQLHSAELLNLYFSPDITRMMRWDRHVARMGLR
jgi:hypothetical protein